MQRLTVTRAPLYTSPGLFLFFFHEKFHFFGREQPPATGPQSRIFQTTDANSSQLDDRKSYEVKHSSNLLIASLMQVNFKP